MPREIQEHAARILSDLKRSWYFRIWFSLWLICFIWVWIALGFFSSFSEDAGEHPYRETWIDKRTTVTFPNYRFRFQLDQSILVASCSINSGKPVQTRIGSPCLYNQTCLHIISRGGSGEDLFACRQGSAMCDNRLFCNVSLVNGTGLEEHMMAWELEGENDGEDDEEEFGPESYASVWIAPNNRAWVLLTPAYDADEKEEEWETALLYHSVTAVHNQWAVTTIINSFDVANYEEEKGGYNGWMAVADIGGWTFFLYLLHCIVMLMVGLCLENNSEFLRPGQGGSAYPTKYENVGGS